MEKKRTEGDIEGLEDVCEPRFKAELCSSSPSEKVVAFRTCPPMPPRAEAQRRGGVFELAWWGRINALLPAFWGD